MDLRKKIKEDLLLALKSHQEFEIRVLRMLQAAIINKEKEKRYKVSKGKQYLSGEELKERSRLDNDEIIELILSESKKRKEAASEFEKGGRQFLAEKEKKEADFLQRYLPEQLSDEDIKRLAKEAVKKLEAKNLRDMGKVMADLRPRVKGKAEGGRVSKVVKELLS